MFRPNTFHYLFIPSESSREKPTRHLQNNTPKQSYNRNGLSMIYNADCTPVLLFLSGMDHLFRKKDRHTLRTAYFRYCKFLLRPPRWHRNKKIIARFGLIDVLSRIRSSSDDLCKKTINFIHVYDPLQPFSILILVN